MENVVRPDTIGRVEDIEAKAELLPRGQYTLNIKPQDLPSAWCGLASESRGPAWRSVPRAAIRRSPETVWGHPPTHPVGTAENGVFPGFA